MGKRKTFIVTPHWSGSVWIGCKSLLLTLLVLFLVAGTACSQEREKEKIQELEELNSIRQQQQARAVIDSAVQFSQAGEYALADKLFLKALKSIKSVPSELAYFFGENSFYLKKYRQSIDWLTKYIQLKGTSGAYSAQASATLKRAEDALLAELSQQKQEATEILSRDFDIDCGPLGKVVCPVCSGRTVLVKRNYLSETYSTCPYCDEHGFLNCADYNKLLRGQLKAKTK